MIDHLSVGSHDIEKSVTFYTECFGALGYSLQHRDQTQAVFGRDGVWSFIVYPTATGAALNGERTHVAFSAASETAVQECYRIATSLGAASLREPGERPDINEKYYGAMFRDPDQHTLEVVHWKVA
ncbi:MAG: VOC family protein [Pseudomonadota bacterium]